MDENIWETIGRFYENSVFIYGTVLLVTYALLAIFSLLAVRAYAKKDKFHQENTLLGSPLAPGITVLAPAFNEGLTIIYNVRSLLTLNYPKYEIIIVNDGSTDDSLQQMIDEFQLVKVDFA